MGDFSAKELARCIELTLAAAEATRRDVERVCARARELALHGVCVNTSRVELAVALLEGSEVQVIALVGFPLGAADADAKRYETEIAVDQGAQEIDFVLNHGWLKDGDRNRVLREMRDVVEAADERPVKVILETPLLARPEVILACELALDSGVKFVGVGTGISVLDAWGEDVKVVRETVGTNLGVKVGGGVRDITAARALIEAGATRLGAGDETALVSGLAQ